MAKYLVKLRRGWKDDATGRNDWQSYRENNPNYLKPQAGELVLEYDNGIPRLKIGDGEHHFEDLPYMSVDSFILPKPASVTLKADGWTREYAEDKITLLDRYSQVVKDDAKGINQFENITITPNSKIDLQPDPNQLIIFHEKDLAFVTENDGGKVTVYCIGQQPQNDYTIQVTVTEVILNA